MDRHLSGKKCAQQLRTRAAVDLNVSRILRKYSSRVRTFLEGRAPVKGSNDEPLDQGALLSLQALGEVLCDDPDLPTGAWRPYIDLLTAMTPEAGSALREGLRELEKRTSQLFPGRDFTELSVANREKVLKKILRRFPHRESNATWRHRLRLTSPNLDLFLSTRASRRFREFVARPLMAWYFSGEKGWKIVGYQDYPGSIVSDRSQRTILGLHELGRTIQLELDDDTFEALDPERLTRNAAGGYEVRVKGGRQIARVPKSFESQVIALTERVTAPPVREPPSRFDAVIVGSGAVGTSTAARLLDAGMSVLMLESGPEADTQPFERMIHASWGLPPWGIPTWEIDHRGDGLKPERFSYRHVGGSATVWGGVALRFHPNDFRMSSLYGVGSDWPFDYQELEPYYVEAEHFMGVAGAHDSPFLPPCSQPHPMDAFEMSATDRAVKAAGERVGVPFHSIPLARNSRVFDGRSKCLNYGICKACPVGAVYTPLHTLERLRVNPRLVLRTKAHVRSVELDEHGRISGVTYSSPGSGETRVDARRVILAAQLIENTRILLNSRSRRFPTGLGNERDQVGRYLMEHPKFFLIGRVGTRLDPYKRGYETATSLKFHDHRERDRFSGGRLIVRENAGPAPSDFARESGQWGAELKAEIRRNFGRFITLGAMMEQLPYWDNRISLSTERDTQGFLKPRIDFRLMRNYETRGYRYLDRILRRVLRSAGAHTIRTLMTPDASGHYMGGHRIGDDPEDSVCDPYCQVHDVPNLYACGNGSFTTAGISNPTLTSVALAFRMSDRIVSDHRASR